MHGLERWLICGAVLMVFGATAAANAQSAYPPPQYYVQQQQTMAPVQPVSPQQPPRYVVPSPPVQQQMPARVYPPRPQPYIHQPRKPTVPPGPAYFATSNSYEAARFARRVRPEWYVGMNLKYIDTSSLEDDRLGDPGETVHATYDYKPGYGGELVGGYQWNDYLRSELTIGYGRQDLDTGVEVIRVAGAETSRSEVDDAEVELEYFTFMANQYVDYPIPGYDDWVPYLGAGIGMLQQNGGEGDSQTLFAYQGLAGLSYFPAPRVAFSADYRYFTAPGFKTRHFEYDLQSHVATIGARYYFGD